MPSKSTSKETKWPNFHLGRPSKVADQKSAIRNYISNLDWILNMFDKSPAKPKIEAISAFMSLPNYTTLADRAFLRMLNAIKDGEDTAASELKDVLIEIQRRTTQMAMSDEFIAYLGIATDKSICAFADMSRYVKDDWPEDKLEMVAGFWQYEAMGQHRREIITKVIESSIFIQSSSKICFFLKPIVYLATVIAIQNWTPEKVTSIIQKLADERRDGTFGYFDPKPDILLFCIRATIIDLQIQDELNQNKCKEEQQDASQNELAPPKSVSSDPNQENTRWETRKIVLRPPCKDLKMPSEILASLGGPNKSERAALANFKLLYLDDKIWDYRTSRPGDPESDSNKELFTYLSILELETEDLPFGILAWVRDSIHYRMSLQQLVNRYAEMLKIQPKYRECQFFSFESWHTLNKNDAGMMERWVHAGGEIWKSGILPAPKANQGHEWRKPEQYLAALVAMKKWDEKTVDDAIEFLHSHGMYENVDSVEDGELGEYDFVGRYEDDDDDDDADVTALKKTTWTSMVAETTSGLAKSLLEVARKL